MKIHEYQAKELLRSFNVSVPNGFVAVTVDEAIASARKLNSSKFVVKAQIHAGGRGKAGGVKIAQSLDEVGYLASEMLGSRLVTVQTDKLGQQVNYILIEEGCDIKYEYYFSILTDRSTQMVCVIISCFGGVEIEEINFHSPEKIFKIFLNPQDGLTLIKAEELARKISVPDHLVLSVAYQLMCLYKAYYETDATLVEINPLVITEQGNVIAIDAKLEIDSNALFRHPEILSYRDIHEENQAEIEAEKFNLAYIQLNGNIGCLVNGAGLAMATMDTIKLFGGEPANFLDVGGGATVETVTEAFKIMFKNPNIKAILVNIFGGIMKCDIIADGLIKACHATTLKIPLVVRINGTNEDIGKKMLEESNLQVIYAYSLSEAASTVVNITKALKS